VLDFFIAQVNTAAWQAYSESQPVPSFVQSNACSELHDWGPMKG